MANAARPPSYAVGTRAFAPTRLVVADSDAVSRAFIVNLVRRYPDVELVAACRNGNEVTEAIESDRPDAVFLSVEIPKMDAFRLIEMVGSDRMPPVVFIASKHDFAARAFDVRALDYLVRPLTRRPVERAVNRAREHVARERLLAAAERLLRQALHREGQDTLAERLIMRADNRMTFVNPAEIDWVKAEGNYVRLHAGAKSYRLRKTMADIEALLGVDNVARIHRCILVRVDRVRELRLTTSGRCDAVLASGTTLSVSRTHRAALQKRLGRR